MDSLPIPLSRVELYLAKIAGMDVTIPAGPESRLEQFLAVLAGDDVEMPTPWSLTEQWLYCVYYGTIFNHPAVEGAFYVDNQKVDARYFAVASGVVGATLPPAPQNRKEQYWAVIAANGPIKGVLKSVTGSNLVLTDVVRGIEELQYVYGDTVQDGEPTPDSPVPISVVTGEQTVDMHGPQLLAKNGMATPVSDSSFWNNVSDTAVQTVLSDGWGRYTSSSQSDASVNLFVSRTGGAPNLKPSTDYTVILEIKDVVSTPTIRICQPSNATDTWSSFRLVTSPVPPTSDTSTLGWNNLKSGEYVVILTSKETLASRVLRMWSSLSVNRAFSMRISIVEGDHSSDWRNYCGGNWQPYQGGTYTLDLSATELCKIGNYQDYIYKSGDDWYLHKAINSTAYQTSDVTLDSHNYTNVKYAQIPKMADSDAYGVYGQKQMLCTHATATGGSNTWDSSANIGHIRSGATTTSYWVGFPPGTTLETMQGALDGAELYYLLKTSTDTKITNATLISQLNAIDSATLPKPIAYITVGAASSNLPAPLKIEYYGRAD